MFYTFITVLFVVNVCVKVRFMCSSGILYESHYVALQCFVASSFIVLRRGCVCTTVFGAKSVVSGVLLSEFFTFISRYVGDDAFRFSCHFKVAIEQQYNRYAGAGWYCSIHYCLPPL